MGPLDFLLSIQILIMAQIADGHKTKSIYNLFVEKLESCMQLVRAVGTTLDLDRSTEKMSRLRYDWNELSFNLKLKRPLLDSLVWCS
jgi:hypothetical protein